MHVYVCVCEFVFVCQNEPCRASDCVGLESAHLYSSRSQFLTRALNTYTLEAPKDAYAGVLKYIHALILDAGIPDF